MSSASQDPADIFNGLSGVSRQESPGSAAGGRSAGAGVGPVPAFVFGEELAQLAERDPRIVVLTADLGRANRALDFAAHHPDRYVNVGIAEKNMISVAAGMAACGFIPFAATFSSFAALLGCEQIRTDCAYPQLPVRVVGHHSGMSMGFYGTSHHSLEDLGILRSIADLTVVCATDAAHLRAVLRASLDHPGAMYIRLGRGRDPEVYRDIPDITIGRAIRVRQGEDLTIIATGAEVRPSLDAAHLLATEGISTRVVDMFTVDPLDAAEVVAAATETAAILTVEEGNVTNGVGTGVVELLMEAGLGNTRVRRHGVPDEHVPVGPPKALYAHYRLDAVGIAAVARELLA